MPGRKEAKSFMKFILFNPYTTPYDTGTVFIRFDFSEEVMEAYQG
jgi:hypothetical protein